MIISVSSGKAHDKIQHPVMTKKRSKRETEGNFLNLINSLCKNAQLAMHLTVKDSVLSPYDQEKRWMSAVTTSVEYHPGGPGQR